MLMHVRICAFDLEPSYVNTGGIMVKSCAQFFFSLFFSLFLGGGGGGGAKEPSGDLVGI